MRYLVIMESVDSAETPPPAEGAAFLEAIVVPSLQALKEMEDGGKIRGGTLTGRRGAAFVVDAASHEELGDLLEQLPVWGTAEVQVTPLDSFAHAAKSTSEAASMLKSM
jgi:muconolactone delta-isomerase